MLQSIQGISTRDSFKAVHVRHREGDSETDYTDVNAHHRPGPQATGRGSSVTDTASFLPKTFPEWDQGSPWSPGPLPAPQSSPLWLNFEADGAGSPPWNLRRDGPTTWEPPGSAGTVSWAAQGGSPVCASLPAWARGINPPPPAGARRPRASEAQPPSLHSSPRAGRSSV